MNSLIFISLIFLAAPLSAYGVQGTFESRTEIFSHEEEEPTSSVIPRLKLEVEQKWKVKKPWTIKLKGYGLTNLEAEEAPENLFADIEEAYGEFKKSDIKLRLGWNTLNWGVLDLNSPMDVIHQKVFFEPFSPIKRGSPMAEIGFSPGNFSFSAIYIPKQPKGKLPSSDSRWYPREVLLNLQSEGGQILLPDEALEYDIASDIVLDKALSHNYGLKFTYQGDPVDIHLMYFEGVASTPTVEPSVSGSIVQIDPNILRADNPVVLSPVFYKVRSAGFGFVKAFESFIVRGESVYQHTISDDPTYSPLFSEWSWQNGIGVEKNWAVGSTTITQLLHYYRSEYPRSSDNLSTSAYRLFDESILLALRWAISDESSAYGSIIYEIPTEGRFWTIGYQSKLSDVLQWDISWRDISADKPGLLDTFRKNDHAFLSLTYFF